MGRLRNHYRWSPEMDTALKDLYGTCPAGEIAEALNARFGTGFTPTAVYNRAVIKQLRVFRTYHQYTAEQVEWLRQNVSKYNSKDLAKEFNKVFSANVDSTSIRNQCGVKGIKLGYASYKGYRSSNYAPVGTEYISNRGKVYVKVSDLPADKEHRNPYINWRLKSHLVWEQHHGEIPEGHAIVYLDGDSLNCDISNLECVPNSINGRIGKSFKGTSPEVKRCAIKMKTLEKILEGIGDQP